MAVKQGQAGTRCRRTRVTRAQPTRRAAPKKTVHVAETLKPEGNEQPPLRPAQCRAYMRKTLACEFREIVAGFVKGAKSGSCQHVKLAAEFLEPRARKSKVPSGKSTLERWVDELERGVS